MKQFYAFLGGMGALIMTACTSGMQRPMPSDLHYFCGEFVQSGDSAIFYDCATGAQYPVSRQDAYVETVRKYIAQKPLPGQRVFLELKGALNPCPHPNNVSPTDSLVIESLIGFDAEGACQSSQLIVGLYETFGPDSVKTILQLKPNYTYVLTNYTRDSIQTSQQGTWGLSSATEAELNRTDTEGFESHIHLRIDPQQDILWHEEGTKTLSYRKIYI